MSDLTDILRKVSSGEDPNAANELMKLAYDELHKKAVVNMSRQPPGHTWQPTELMHEMWLKLFAHDPNHNFVNGAHFFCIVNQAMHQILVDHARRRSALKRGQPVMDMSYTEFANLAHEAPDELLLAVHDALELFKKNNERAAQLIDLKFFGGLPMKKCAEVLGISLRTAEGHYTYFKTWFRREFGRKMNL